MWRENSTWLRASYDDEQHTGNAAFTRRDVGRREWQTAVPRLEGRIDAGLIDELRHHKAELIALLEAEQAPAGCAPTPTQTQAQAGPIKRQRTPSIPRVSRDEPVPLALPQESLWFLHRIDPENVADHVWAAWTLEGEIDRDIVQRTLDTLVTRHEALRDRRCR